MERIEELSILINGTRIDISMNDTVIVQRDSIWKDLDTSESFSFDCPECNARMFSDYAECFCGWVNVNRVAL